MAKEEKPLTKYPCTLSTMNVRLLGFFSYSIIIVEKGWVLTNCSRMLCTEIQYEYQKNTRKSMIKTSSGFPRSRHNLDKAGVFEGCDQGNFHSVLHLPQNLHYFRLCKKDSIALLIPSQKDTTTVA